MYLSSEITECKHVEYFQPRKTVLVDFGPENNILIILHSDPQNLNMNLVANFHATPLGKLAI